MTPREFWLDHFVTNGTVIVFSNSMEGAGLPTLFDMQQLAKAMGLEVDHAGYGVFIAKDAGRHVFCFCGGGAMSRLAFDVPGAAADTEVSYTDLSFDSRRDEGLAWLRARHPMLFAEADCRHVEKQLREEAGRVAAEKERQEAEAARQIERVIVIERDNEKTPWQGRVVSAARGILCMGPLCSTQAKAIEAVTRKYEKRTGRTVVA